MSDYKDFQGKSLDEAIEAACVFYGVPREKLEIDIVNDAKSGIFGLVGVKKACIRAKRADLGDLAAVKPAGKSGAPEKKSAAVKAETAPDARNAAEKTAPAAREDVFRPAEPQPRAARSAPRERDDAPKPARQRQQPETEGRVTKTPAKGRKERRPDASKAADAPGETPAPRGRREQRHPRAEVDAARGGQEKAAPLDDDSRDIQITPLAELDAAKVEEAVFSVIRELASAVTDGFDCRVSLDLEHNKVLAECQDPEGGLLGREGQTLAAVQYLAVRMASRKLGANLRLQINIDGLRERQDEETREMALSLAEKVKAGGKSQSTRPLSSYHRRLIHMTLQDDKEVQTYSKGEGSMRRVIVSLSKKNVPA